MFDIGLNYFYEGEAEYGGSVCLIDSKGIIDDNFFNESYAEMQGGAVYLINTDCEIQGNDFNDNYAGNF